MNQAIALAPAERAAVALKSQQIESELKELAAASADIVAVVDKAGRDQVHRIGMTLKARRVDIEKAGKEARDDATQFSKAVIAEQARLVGFISGEETRILKLRDDFDAEQERVRQAEIKAEQDRIQRHQDNIEAIRRIPAFAVGKTSEEIAAALKGCETAVVGDDWQEYREKAVAAMTEAADRLRQMHAAAVAREEAARAEVAAREAAQKRIEEERAELAKQQAAQAEAARVLALEQAELRRQMEEAATRVRAEAARQKAEADAQTAEQQRVAAETKRQLEAQQAAINEQRLAADAEMKRQADELAAKQAAFEAQQAAARQAKEAAEQLERDHAEALAMNAEWVPPFVVSGVLNMSAKASPELLDAIKNGDVVDADFREVVTPPTLRLGQISERLGFSVTADFLLFLGFSHAATDRAAKLYHERDFPSMCAALIRHVDAVRAAHSA